MCIINFLIDTRFRGYSATVAIVGLTLIVKSTAKNDSIEKKYSFCSKKNIINAESINESYKFTETLKVKTSPIYLKK